MLLLRKLFLPSILRFENVALRPYMHSLIKLQSNIQTSREVNLRWNSGNRQVKGWKLTFGMLSGNRLDIIQKTWEGRVNSQLSLAEWSFSRWPVLWLPCWYWWLLWSYLLSWPLIFPYLSYSCNSFFLNILMVIS